MHVRIGQKIPDEALGKIIEDLMVQLPRNNKEISSIGSQPVFNTSTNQTFTINGVKPRMASVPLNEEPIRSEDLFVVTNQEKIKWSTPGVSGTEIIVVNPQQSFIEEYKQITQSSKSALVLVNQKHNLAFNELRDISIKTQLKTRD